jgi:hypothetical protein
MCLSNFNLIMKPFGYPNWNISVDYYPWVTPRKTKHTLPT